MDTVQNSVQKIILKIDLQMSANKHVQKDCIQIFKKDSAKISYKA